MLFAILGAINFGLLSLLIISMIIDWRKVGDVVAVLVIGQFMVNAIAMWVMSDRDYLWFLGTSVVVLAIYIISREEGECS